MGRDGVYEGLWLGVRERERENAKQTCFSAGRAVYVHYIKDIRQGALQSDCLMLFGGARVPVPVITLVGRFGLLWVDTFM